CGRLCQRVLLQERSQPGQEPGFIGVTQGDLDLTSLNRDVAVSTCRCLWQCWDCLTLGLSLGWLGWCLSGAIAGAVKLCQLLLGQRHRSLVNAIGQAMLAEALGCFGIVLTGALAIDHKVGHGAVTLAGYLGCAISLQLDVTSQDDLNRAIHAAMAFWQ